MLSLNDQHPVESLSRAHTPSTLFVYDGELSHDNGVSNYMLTIGNYLTEQGCEVNYLVGKNSTDLPKVYAPSKTINVFANGSTSAVPIYTSDKEIREVLEKTDPTAVHVQLPFVPFMAGKAIKAIIKDVELIGTFHTPMPHGWLRTVNSINAKLTHQEVDQFDHFFSVSETAQQAAQEVYGVSSELLPCPINFNEASRQPTDRTKSTTTVSFIGRLVARKGATDFIESMELIEPDVREKIQAQVIGDGPLRSTLEQRVANKGLDQTVRFLGKVVNERKFELLSSSDIVVCPSTSAESFGIVIAEAMAAGRPAVIASDIPGYRDVLGGAPESLFPCGNPTALARKIEDLVSRPDTKDILFTAQQQLVKAFDIRSTIGPRLVSTYGLEGLKSN